MTLLVKSLTVISEKSLAPEAGNALTNITKYLFFKMTHHGQVNV